MSLTTQGNYSAGLIAANSESCQPSRRTAVTQAQYGHPGIVLNGTIMSAQWQLFLFTVYVDAVWY